MGDPRKSKKKYSTPTHPWQKDRLEQETKLRQEYGLKTKKEIWKMNSLLEKWKSQVKRITRSGGSQIEKEKADLIAKLQKMGLVQPDTDIGDVLGLDLENIMERRLQSQLVRKGLATTMKQARQMITHKHVEVDGKKITSPSYLVTVKEQALIKFADNSSFILEEAARPAADAPAAESVSVAEETPKTVEELKDEVQPSEQADEIKEKLEQAADEVVKEPKTEEKAEAENKEGAEEEPKVEAAEKPAEEPEEKKEEAEESKAEEVTEEKTEAEEQAVEEVEPKEEPKAEEAEDKKAEEQK